MVRRRAPDEIVEADRCGRRGPASRSCRPAWRAASGIGTLLCRSLDLLSVLEPAPPARRPQRAAAQIVVMAPSNGARFGLMVDDLGEIAEVLTERPHAAASHGRRNQRHVRATPALAPNGDDDGDLIVMLRADLLHEQLWLALTLGAAPAGAAAGRPARPAPSKRAAVA